jgi:cytosine/adenosine deaminase-related metal-dependent hydrolase
MMNALDQLACGLNQWVVVNALYFDSPTHCFLRGDLEIEGDRIARILAPNTSSYLNRWDAGESVCVPGLIDADASAGPGEWLACSDDLVKRGVTTAGSFQRGLPEHGAWTERSGVRRVVYVELSEEGIDAQQLAMLGAHYARCTVLPAVVPAHIWSARSLMSIAAVAERLNKPLCVRLCPTHDAGRDYLQTRFFTEIGLLSYLSILRGRTTLFGPADVSRQDTALIAETNVSVVCDPSLMRASLIEHRSWTHWLMDRALGASFNARELDSLTSQAAEMALNATACDAWIDSLTCGAAQAIGLSELGSIAAGKRADFSLYDMSSSWPNTAGSMEFAGLIATQTPRHVFIEGMAEVVNSALTDDLSVASAA